MEETKDERTPKKEKTKTMMLLVMALLLLRSRQQNLRQTHFPHLTGHLKHQKNWWDSPCPNISNIVDTWSYSTRTNPALSMHPRSNHWTLYSFCAEREIGCMALLPKSSNLTAREVTNQAYDSFWIVEGVPRQFIEALGALDMLVNKVQVNWVDLDKGPKLPDEAVRGNHLILFSWPKHYLCGCLRNYLHSCCINVNVPQKKIVVLTSKKSPCYVLGISIESWAHTNHCDVCPSIELIRWSNFVFHVMHGIV